MMLRGKKIVYQQGGLDPVVRSAHTGRRPVKKTRGRLGPNTTVDGALIDTTFSTPYM